MVKYFERKKLQGQVLILIATVKLQNNSSEAKNVTCLCSIHWNTVLLETNIKVIEDGETYNETIRTIQYAGYELWSLKLLPFFENDAFYIIKGTKSQWHFWRKRYGENCMQSLSQTLL